jgi:hypothetical protein
MSVNVTKADLQAAQRRRALLSELASRQGLDYDTEALSPGTSPEQHAYHFVSCGADLLIALTRPESIPSKSKRTRKQVAKAIGANIESRRAQEAAVFLAHAMACLLCEAHEDARHPDEAALHLAFRGLVHDSYPIPETTIALVEDCRAEHRVMDTHEVRREVAIAVESGTGYHRALLDPDFLGGRNPDEDPDLREIQERYANSYLRGRAVLTALRLVLGDAEFAVVEPKLLGPGALETERLAMELGEASDWNFVAERWYGYARLAMAGETGPAS